MDDFLQRIKREYWVTSEGDKLYAHEFEDEHLKNTINFIVRQCGLFRITRAREMSELVKRTAYRHLDIDTYYHHFWSEVNKFIDTTISNQKWLCQHSNLFPILLDEAKYRNIEIEFSSEIYVQYTPKEREQRSRRKTNINGGTYHYSVMG